MTRIWFTAWVAFAIASGAVQAAEFDIKTKAKAVEQKSAIGQYEEAWSDFQDLETLLWEKRRLGIEAAVFVETPATGYGQYQPRDTSEFQKDEPIFIYLQPVGYGYGRVDDLFKIALTADFQLRTPSGQVLAEQDGFSSQTLESRVANREFQISFSFTFEGLEPGRYSLMIRIRDENGGQTSETVLPFSIGSDPQ